MNLDVSRSRASSLHDKATSANTEELKLEEETLKREFEWLLHTEFDHTLQAINKCLNECAKKFAIVLEPSSGVEPYKILLRHPQQGEPVVCVAAVNGDKISKADITLRLPGRLGASKPLRTSIKEHAAWKLRQIQDSANQFLLAQQQLSAITESKHKLTTPSVLLQAFLELSNCLHEAEKVLVVPKLPSVAEIYSAELRSHFKPELPEDIVVHFHINSYRLVLTIFNVSLVSNKTPTTSSSTNHSFEVGTVFEYGNSSYEVTSQLQVQSVVPWLSGVLQWLQETQEITQDFINKVKTVSL